MSLESPNEMFFKFLIKFCNQLISLIEKKRTHSGMTHLFQICSLLYIYITYTTVKYKIYRAYTCALYYNHDKIYNNIIYIV